jgi:hypothetical protein
MIVLKKNREKENLDECRGRVIEREEENFG